MPIGIVSDSDFETELLKQESHISKTEVGVVLDKNPIGRPRNSVEVPDSLRKVIGGESVESGRKDAVALANHFGVSESSVSAYSNGATSTASYNEPSSSLSGHIKQVKEKIGIKARNRLIQALDQITPEKLQEAGLKVVSQVAKDMSAIVKDMESDPRIEVDNKRPVFVFYSPQQKTESNFEIITVPE